MFSLQPNILHVFNPAKHILFNFMNYLSTFLPQGPCAYNFSDSSFLYYVCDYLTLSQNPQSQHDFVSYNLWMFPY